jgi:hypothetical protein
MNDELTNDEPTQVVFASLLLLPPLLPLLVLPLPQL